MRKTSKKRPFARVLLAFSAIVLAAIVTGCNSGPAPGSKEEAAAFAGNPNSPQAQAAAQSAAAASAQKGAEDRATAQKSGAPAAP